MTVNEVSIDIDLNIGEAMSKIGALKAQMETLGDNMNLHLDSDNFDFDFDGSSIDTDSLKKSVQDSLGDVDENIPIPTALEDPSIDSDSIDLNEQELETKVKARIGDKEVETSLRNALDQNFYTGDNVKEGSIPDRIKRKMKHPGEADRTKDIFPEFRGLMDGGGTGSTVFGGFDPVRREPRKSVSAPTTKDLFPDIVNNRERRKNILSAESELLGKVGRKMKKIIPSFRIWRKIIAFLLPQLIVLAGAALGVASAFGAIGMAGAAILGLGLIGHGDDMASSFKNAKNQVKELKQDLFTAFQGPAQKFAPIQERLFNMIPGEMASLSEEMEELTSFEGTVELGIKGTIGLVEELVALFNKHEDQISRIGALFGGIISDNIVGFFKFFINEIESSHAVLIAIGSAIKKVLKILYNLSKALSGILLVFKPLLHIILLLSKLLNNKFVMSLISGIAVVAALTFAITSLSAALTALSGMIILGAIAAIDMAITSLYGYTVAMWEAVGATTALASALSYITLGGVAIAGAFAAKSTFDTLSSGMGEMGAGGYNDGTTVINNREINVQGSPAQKDMEALRDENNRTRGQMGIEDKREQP